MRTVGLMIPVLLLHVGAAAPAASQADATRGGARFGVAGTWSGLVDRNASALHYQGPGAGAGIGWRGVYDNSRFDISLTASASRLSSRITAGRANRESALNTELRLAALRRLPSLSSGGLSAFAGGQVLLSGLGRQHNFSNATETFADLFGTLSATGMWEYQARDLIVSGTIALPIVSVVGRTPYYGLKTTPELRLRGPLSLSMLTHTLRVERPVTPRLTVLMDYRTTLQRDDDPRSIRRIEHWLGMGVEFRRGAR
jgi:hypothetical protein